MQDGPVIVDASIVPGHDGSAEALITIRYENGAHRSMAVTGSAIESVLARTGLSSLDDLAGQPWTVLVDGTGGRQTA